MTSGAAVVDLNGDASPEIVFGTWLNKLHAYQLDGTELAGFPVELGGRLRSAPVVANIDNSTDGSLEIILGSDDDVLYCYDAGGQLVWEFTGSSQNIQSAAAVSDMDGDGDSEIIFTSLDRNVYVLDHSGAVLEGFPVETGGAIYSSPVVGDVDGDGIAEIFFGSDDDAIYGLNLDGSLVGGFPVITASNVKGTPTLDDLDLDGDVEVVIGLDGALAVVDIMSASDLSVRPSFSTDRGNLHRDGFYSASPVSVSDEPRLPSAVTLHPNYPNPFNPQTNIMYSLPVAQKVSLTVRDILGRQVVVLDQGLRSAGTHTVVWRGLDARGQDMDSGVYFYQLESEGGLQTAKMIYLK
jgi:outer membrane protein assembly factor BamB